jgi:hypothetical protein
MKTLRPISYVRGVMRFATVLASTLLLSVPVRTFCQPKPVASTDTLKFGLVVLHDSKSMFLSIKNEGTAPVNYGGATGPFSVDYKMKTVGFKSPLDPDSTIGFNVTFSPQSITANHVHLDSVHFAFTGLPDVVVQLVGYDRIPILDTVSIDDTFLGFAGQIITIAQRLDGPLSGALDSIKSFSEYLTYDPQVMTLQSVLPGSCLQGWNVPSPPLELVLGHPLIRGTATYRAMTGPGQFLLLSFRVVPTAQTFQWTSIVQSNVFFGNGFEPLMSSRSGKATVIDSCTSVTTSIVAPGSMIEPNMPNPFQTETVFTYQVGKSQNGETSHVRLRLYDARGQLVACPVDRDASMGTYSVRLSRGDLAAGVYSCVYEAGTYLAVRKVIVLP